MSPRSVLIAALLAGALAPHASAGDRALEVVFSNLTPDAAADAPSDACIDEIARVFRDDEVALKKVGETRLRALVKQPQGGPEFVTWSWASFEAAKREVHTNGYADAVVLVDCQPSKGTLTALIAPAHRGVRRIFVRAELGAKPAITAIGRRLLAQAWAGFSP